MKTCEETSERLKTAYQGTGFANKVSTPLFNNSSIQFNNGSPSAPHSQQPQQKLLHPHGNLSNVEAAILRSNDVPVHLYDDDGQAPEEIEVNGNRGIWANKSEVKSWKGAQPIDSYPINEDPTPEILVKKSNFLIEYIQEMAIRYLKPPTPEPPGDIIITKLPDEPEPPAPPIIIRQQPPRPPTPEPVVLREAPPKPPPRVGQKIITIAGKKLPPPPRKVIIEQLAPLPQKPRAILVERWLPYQNTTKRKVIYQRNNNCAQVLKPKNIIIQWEQPQVALRRQVKYLGVVNANPVEYTKRYGHCLKRSDQLPQFVKDIKTPEGIELAADVERRQKQRNENTTVYELEGDVEALMLVDLEREGLGEYRDQLNRRLVNSVMVKSRTPVAKSSSRAASENNFTDDSIESNTSTLGIQLLSLSTPPGTAPATAATAVASSILSTKSIRSTRSAHDVVESMLRALPRRLTVEEAERTLLSVNSRLGRRLGQEDVTTFFSMLSVSGLDGCIDKNEFKSLLVDAKINKKDHHEAL